MGLPKWEVGAGGLAFYFALVAGFSMATAAVTTKREEELQALITEWAYGLSFFERWQERGVRKGLLAAVIMLLGAGAVLGHAAEQGINAAKSRLEVLAAPSID